MSNKTKKDLIRRVAEDLPDISDVKLTKMVNYLLNDIIEQAQADHVVSLTNLGTVKQRHKSARMGRNPLTQAPATIKERDVLLFKLRSYLQP